jgi:putative peptidoglycan lipid II flippase
VREVLQAQCIGAGMEQSAFTLAFAIPNAARKLFGEGALTAAFVPVFKGEVESSSIEKASRLARAVMTMTLLMLGAIVVLALGAVEIVSRYSAQLGFEDLERLSLTLRLVKTLLPYMIFICGAAFGMGVLNALGRFKASSFMPCILNIFWIAALGCISFFPGLSLDRRIHIVAFAILSAGAAQMSFLFWRMAKAGVKPHLSFTGWGDEKVRLVWRNVAVAAMGAGAVQINYLLDQGLAYYASDWAAGVIGYAERLMDLPLGVIGVAFGTVLLPTFAGLFAKGDVAGARSTLLSSVQSLMFVMLPAAAGLLVLAPEVTGVIYQRGEFDAVATLRDSRALAVYALGLGLFGMSKSLVPWFLAQNDMKTPLYVSCGAVGVNAVLNIAAVLLLPVEWRHVGLAASTVVCAGASCAALIALARRRNGELGLVHALPSLAKMLAASALMGGVLWFVKPHVAALSDALIHSRQAADMASLGVLVLTGILVYFAVAAVALRDNLKRLRRRGRGT